METIWLLWEDEADNVEGRAERQKEMKSFMISLEMLDQTSPEGKILHDFILATSTHKFSLLFELGFPIICN